MPPSFKLRVSVDWTKETKLKDQHGNTLQLPPNPTGTGFTIDGPLPDEGMELSAEKDLNLPGLPSGGVITCTIRPAGLSEPELSLDEDRNPATRQQLEGRFLKLTGVHEMAHAVGMHHHGEVLNGRPLRKDTERKGDIFTGDTRCPTRYITGGHEAFLWVVVHTLFPGRHQRTLEGLRFCKLGETYVVFEGGKKQQKRNRHGCMSQLSAR